MHNITNESILETLENSDPAKLKNIVEGCRSIARDNHLSIDGKPIPFISVPRVFKMEQVKPVFDNLRIFLNALMKMETFALCPDGRDLFERLMNSLTPGGRHLVSQFMAESDFSMKRRQKRIDGYLDPSTGGYSIIEVNQAAPLAISYHDTCQKIACYMLNSLGFDIPPRLNAPHILQWFIDEYQHRFPGRFPYSIALVIEHGYPPKFTDLPQMALNVEKIALNEFGEKMSIIRCFPYEISLKNGRIFAGETEINMIWRNSVYMTHYREEGLAIEDYEEICSHPERHVIINSGRNWLTRTKETFSIFHDNRYCRAMGLSEQEKTVCRKIVPLSFNLKYSPEKIEQIRKGKDQWITKPSDAGFGAGMEFGENHTIESWNKIIDERSTKHGFIFQKRVKYPEIQIPDLDSEGRLIKRLAEFDFCPQHINGEFHGTALSRANMAENTKTANKMNLVAGGYMLPLFMI